MKLTEERKSTWTKSEIVQILLQSVKYTPYAHIILKVSTKHISTLLTCTLCRSPHLYYITKHRTTKQ